MPTSPQAYVGAAPSIRRRRVLREYRPRNNSNLLDSTTQPQLAWQFWVRLWWCAEGAQRGDNSPRKPKSGRESETVNGVQDKKQQTWNNTCFDSRKCLSFHSDRTSQPCLRHMRATLHVSSLSTNSDKHEGLTSEGLSSSRRQHPRLL